MKIARYIEVSYALAEAEGDFEKGNLWVRKTTALQVPPISIKLSSQVISSLVLIQRPGPSCSKVE